VPPLHFLAIVQGYRPGIGNSAMYSLVKPTPRDTNVIFNDQYNAYIDTGTNRYWDQSRFQEHEYLLP
jgi:hypothetical protein